MHGAPPITYAAWMVHVRLAGMLACTRLAAGRGGAQQHAARSSLARVWRCWSGGRLWWCGADPLCLVVCVIRRKYMYS